MNISLLNILKWIVYIIHLLSGSVTIVFYIFFLQADFFINITEKALIIFFGSSFVATLFYKTQKQSIKKYFRVLSLLALSYLGIWIVLGLIMIHR
jgi:hypothetical protein